jgi:hypothetical protein
MAGITRHGLNGGPRQLYGTFAGKIPENVRITRLGLYGGPRPPYGTFGGKTSSALRSAKHEGLRRNIGRMMR